MWALYDALLDGLPAGVRVAATCAGPWWSCARTDAGGCGLAMTTAGDTRPALFPDGLAGLPLREAAQAVRSWNYAEAGLGMAAANAFYNTPARLAALGCAEPYDNYCTRGLDLAGKTVGLVGHLKMPEAVLRDAARVYILERHPQPGDYPDAACEDLLPACEVVLITGSALVNKTLPRLLALARGAFVILTGPTVPLCPALLDCGIDRLAGLAVTDADGAAAHAASGRPGPPYGFGQTFLLGRDIP